MFSEKKKKKPVPPSCGSNATPLEKDNSKKKEEKRKKKEKQQKAADGLKLVVSMAKIQCPLCTNPIGTLMVTDLNPTIQNKPTATETDKKKTNLLFTGTCTKSPNMAAPCIGIIQPGQWKDTGSLKVQDKAPLLFKSSIKCMYGSADIKFLNCGQLKPPFAYDAPGPNKESEKEETINIRVSVFFDGTGNNKENTTCRLEYDKKIRDLPHDADYANVYEKKEREYLKKAMDGKPYKTDDDSYENDFSNVARLFKYYKENLNNEQERFGCVYIEGVGTTNLAKDDTLSQGLGYGKGTGVLDKVKVGCQKTAERIQKLAGEKKIDTLIIDVFGFSRGAAAARNFLHEITLEHKDAHVVSTFNGQYYTNIQVPAQPARGELGRLLEEKSVKFDNDKFKISFAGLFDTVAAYGIIKWDNVTVLSLNAVKKARTVLHLTAMDERRTNFPLINVKSKGAAYEKSLPGVHSDVGGCYNHLINEEKSAVFIGNSSEITEEIENLVDDGWYTSNNLIPNYSGFKTLASNIYSTDFQKHGRLIGKRFNISNEYSFIPLFIMCKAAMAKPAYLKFQDKQIEKSFKIPNELNYINDRLNDYVFNGGIPMQFYIREELDREIKLARALDNPRETMASERYIAEPVSTYVAPKKDINLLQPTITNESNTALNPDEFSKHPDLQRKIKDHVELLKLHKQYLHVSHNCDSYFKVINIMDPYSRSIRSGKIRKQYDG